MENDHETGKACSNPGYSTRGREKASFDTAQYELPSEVCRSIQVTMVALELSWNLAPLVGLGKNANALVLLRPKRHTDKIALRTLHWDHL